MTACDDPPCPPPAHRSARRKLDQRARGVAMVLATACLVLAASVLVGGWMGGIEVLKRVYPSFVPMAPSTGACFLLMSVGLLLRLRRPVLEPLPAGLWISLAVASVAALNLVLSRPGRVNSVEQLLLRDWPAEVAMAAGTELEFLAAVYCLATLSHERFWNERAFGTVATGGLLFAGVAVVGYLFQSSDLYEALLFDPMALHSALGFLLLHAAFLLSEPQGTWISILLGRGSGSRRARRLFPLALATPLALCFCTLLMTEWGIFSANFRLALLAIAMMAMSAALVLLTAQKQNQVEHMAQHDPLTGLANRSLFNERLRQALDEARALGHELGLLTFDVDHFKSINDTLGHPAGDTLLCIVADRLRKGLSATDTAARIGGDEFAVILAGRDNYSAIERDARSLFARLGRAALVGGRQLHPSLSVGVATFPADADTAEQLVVSADVALYDAKARGRRRLHLFGGAAEAASAL